MPTVDRDAGSLFVDYTIRFLLDAGWRVTFLAGQEPEAVERRHADRLRRMGVETYAGFAWAERILRSADIDLALISYWEPASRLIPLVRRHSPATRVLLNTIDLNFLRDARRSYSQRAALDGAYGGAVAKRAEHLRPGRRPDDGVGQGARPARRLPGQAGVHPAARRGRAAVAAPGRRPPGDDVRRQLPPPPQSRGRRAPVRRGAAARGQRSCSNAIHSPCSAAGSTRSAWTSTRPAPASTWWDGCHRSGLTWSAPGSPSSPFATAPASRARSSSR